MLAYENQMENELNILIQFNILCEVLLHFLVLDIWQHNENLWNSLRKLFVLFFVL